MTDIDVDALGDIADAIEAAGGVIKDIDTEQAQPSGFAGMMAQMTGATHTHYVLEVCIPGPTTADIPDVDSGLVAQDAAKAVAVAHNWANEEGLDALAADLNGIGKRIAEQATGASHPADEMEQFQDGDGE